jgi:hypothetical protein
VFSNPSNSFYLRIWGWVLVKGTGGGVKGIKTGNKVQISGGESINKRAIIYTSALVNEARIRKEAKERIDAEG